MVNIVFAKRDHIAHVFALPLRVALNFVMFGRDAMKGKPIHRNRISVIQSQWKIYFAFYPFGNKNPVSLGYDKSDAGVVLEDGNNGFGVEVVRVVMTGADDGNIA